MPLNRVDAYIIPSITPSNFTIPGRNSDNDAYIQSYQPTWTASPTNLATLRSYQIDDDDAYFHDRAAPIIGMSPDSDFQSASSYDPAISGAQDRNAEALSAAQSGVASQQTIVANFTGGPTPVTYEAQSAGHIIAVPNGYPTVPPILVSIVSFRDTTTGRIFYRYSPLSNGGVVDFTPGETYTFFHPNNPALIDPAPGGLGIDVSQPGVLAGGVTSQGTFANGTAEYSMFLCFTRGTLIDTPNGPVAVEDLSKGDLVTTLDRGAQAIKCITSSMARHDRLVEKENMRPIMIKAGALGDGMPARDLAVSPQHRVLIRSDIAKTMFGHDEVFVAAKHLCAIDGIDVMAPNGDVEYFHILFDNHNVVLSNGALTESFYTGPWALKSISQKARQEIFALYPEIQEEGYKPVPARPLTTPKEGRELAKRHIQAGVALVKKDAIKTSAA